MLRREPPPPLARRVDRALPFFAGTAAVAGVLITALSGVPARLPGIALDSTPLFLVERGAAVVAALIVVTGLVARTLKRELPIGFPMATGLLTYAETVEDATSSSDTAVAELETRLDKQKAELSGLNETVDRLVDSAAETRTVIAKISAVVLPEQGRNPPPT
jgi:hypothetical protein